MLRLRRQRQVASSCDSRLLAGRRVRCSFGGGAVSFASGHPFVDFGAAAGVFALACQHLAGDCSHGLVSGVLAGGARHAP